MNIRVVMLLSLGVLASCTTRPPLASTEIFDEQTASTLLVVSKPLVFARERSDVEAHSRDYATLVAVEDDRSGQYSQYILLYRWSTVDPRMSPPPAQDAGALKILADGRTFDLKPVERAPTSLTQHRALHVPEHADVVYRAYRVDSAILRFIADSRELAVRMPQEPLDTLFFIWEDGRPALTEFLRRASAP